MDNQKNIQLRIQYLIGFLDGLNKADAYNTYHLEEEYKARLDELKRLENNENTINEGNSNT